MPSTSDVLIKPSSASILVIGDSGTRKTRFISTLPKPYVFDFDKGVASLSDTPGITYDTFKDAPYEHGTTMLAEGIYPYGTAWTAFHKKLNEVGAMIDKGTCPYEAICLDSMTLLSEIAMNNVLKTDGKPGQQPQIQHWGAQTRALGSLMDQLTSWPQVIKYATCHIQRTENDLTKTVELLPLLTGKFAGKISVYFDEVYFAEVKTEGVAPHITYKPIFNTAATSVRRQAKSRWNVPDGTVQDWPTIVKLVESGRKK